MKPKFIALLSLVYYCPIVFAEPLANASYKEVCEQMDQKGISTRTQSHPNSQQFVDNVVVVAEGHTSHRGQSQAVANSDILVGASLTRINTVNSGPNQVSGSVAQSADPCR